MWLARQQKAQAVEETGEVGRVTLAEEAPAVELDGERRGLCVYAPGGYRWRPALGQKVLVLKADGDPCVVGTPSAGGLAPGEVALDSGGGAAIRLDNQGRVTLGRDAAVTGALYVGGVELTALVRGVVREELAKQG